MKIFIQIQTIIYKECHLNCKKCNKDGDNNSNNCIECIDGLYLIENDPNNNCVNNLQNSNYYFNITEKKYEEVPTNISNYCRKCKNDLSFRIDDNTHSCFNSPSSQNYYLDLNDNIYKKCYNNCRTCNEGGDDNNNNCITCISNLHFYSNDNTKSCYLNSPGEIIIQIMIIHIVNVILIEENVLLVEIIKKKIMIFVI